MGYYAKNDRRSPTWLSVQEIRREKSPSMISFHQNEVKIRHSNYFRHKKQTYSGYFDLNIRKSDRKQGAPNSFFSKR